MPAHAHEPAYISVLNDSFIQKNVDCVSTYLLGQPNQARRIRDVNGVLLKYVEIGVTCWSYWSLLIKVALLAVNVTAIFFAFLTYKSPKKDEWRFEVPSRIVVWAEFIGILFYLAFFVWRFFLWVWAGISECTSPEDFVYHRNLEFCTKVRRLYNAVMKLDFNLLIFLNYVSPPAVMAALAKARRKVYGKYGTRVHREDSCMDLYCCCCFYSRLCICSLFQSVLVLTFMGFSLGCVLIKVLQLRFIGNLDVKSWSATEFLLFVQFLINMAYLDTRQKSRRKGKVELLFHGADAEESDAERNARKLLEDLALLMMRYRYSLLTSLVIHHSITADDISYLYIEDQLEEDKPRNAVRHEYQQGHRGSGSNQTGHDPTCGGSGPSGGGPPPVPSPPPAPMAPPSTTASYVYSQAGQLYDNNDWSFHPPPNPSPRPSFSPAAPTPSPLTLPTLATVSPPAPPSGRLSSRLSNVQRPAGGNRYLPPSTGSSTNTYYGDAPRISTVRPAQVVLEMSPPRQRAQSQAPSRQPSELPTPRLRPSAPSAPSLEPPPPPVSPPMLPEAPMRGHFPYDFYTNGHPTGAPLRGTSPQRLAPLQLQPLQMQPQLHRPRSNYEGSSVWSGQGR